MDTNSQTTSWGQLTWISGISSTLFYFGAAFAPLPDSIAMLLAFAFGPLLTVSFYSVNRFFSATRASIRLEIASLLGVIAGTMVTLMLVIQIGNGIVRADALAEAATESTREAIQQAWRAVNRVQYLIDVVWDIFICSASVLLGTYLYSHPRYGKIWGGSGVVAGALLLFLNLQTFPTAPAEAGSIDLGPVVALWFTAVFVRMIFLTKPAREDIQTS